MLNTSQEPSTTNEDGRVQMDTTRKDLVTALRRGIMSGEYSPNQRLIEIDICEQFHARRAIVREAFLQLEIEGLVERVQNRGSRVRAISVTEAVELSELRMVIEALCARKAAERITDEQIAEFQELRTSITTAIAASDLAIYSQLNRNLHQRIMEISGQKTEQHTLERLNARNNHRRRLPYASGRATISAKEHIAIIGAIVARDPDAAERTMREHLRIVISWLLDADTDSQSQDDDTY